MICSTRTQSNDHKTAAARAIVDRRTNGPQQSLYGWPFWNAYLANFLVMIAIALLFRYADFVAVLGGSELHLGWIVGIGMVGSLAARVFLGGAIDRYGTRRVWLAALLLFSLCCFGHLFVTSCRGLAIYVLRILFCCGIAGIFGASMTFISGRAPTARMAEMLGMLGTSGFVGMVFGSQLGDFLCGTKTIVRSQTDHMFLIAGALALVACIFSWRATRGQQTPRPRRRPPLTWLLRRYQPGTVLLVGAAMGIGLSLPGTFLRTYAAQLDIARIGLFFAVYAPTAIVTRLTTRRLPERFGLRPMILTGITLIILSQFVFLVVRNEWSLMVPGFVYGMAHAILYPPTVALGSSAFPNRYRGLGTTLMLATYDFGQLVGAPIAGWIVHSSVSIGLPGYPTMFCTVAGLFLVVGVLFAISRPVRRREPAASTPAPLAAPKSQADHDDASCPDRLSAAP